MPGHVRLSLVVERGNHGFAIRLCVQVSLHCCRLVNHAWECCLKQPGIESHIPGRNLIEFWNTTDVIRDLDISIDEKIRRLVRAEETENDRKVDAAHAARSAKARDYTRPSRHAASESRGGNVDQLLLCYFCKEDHWLRNCPYLVKAQRWLAKYKTAKFAQNTPSTNPSQSSSSGWKSKSHGYNADDTQDSDGSISVGSVSDDDVEDCLLFKDVI
ncbi:hypothetical protein E4U52_004821 [Claviceps spartinae]|nr:hypothetical protein E4U52_004821 [Claviceps spartinae]